MTTREKNLIGVLVLAGLAYLLARTRKGESVTATIFDKIASLISGEEGEKLTVYKDSGGAWTVGKGHLVLSTDRVMRNGAAVKLVPYGPVGEITKAESDEFFARDTETARNAVSNLVRVPITDNQRAALASLVFNIGVGAFRNSTLLKKLNAGDYQGAADQFLVWRLDNGVIVPALLARRNREREIFLT